MTKKKAPKTRVKEKQSARDKGVSRREKSKPAPAAKRVAGSAEKPAALRKKASEAAPAREGSKLRQRPLDSKAAGPRVLEGKGLARGASHAGRSRVASAPEALGRRAERPQKVAPEKPSKVVPKPVPTRKIERAELERIRKLLDAKKQALSRHLEVELTELERPEKKHRADLEEIASDTHETDSLCEIMGMESTQIDQIDRALTKIENGTYGVCEDCGGEIPFVRLEALPFATQCVACKRRAEIQGQISAAESSAQPL